VRLSVCQHWNVPTPTSLPVLKLWDTQGYLWLSYDLMKVIKLIGEIFEPIFFFFQNTLCHSFLIIVIPSVLLSFLPDYCHSFRIIVIPSGLLSFLPDYCHSFRIIVISSILVSFLPNIVIPSELFRELQIHTN
jgi:hypothetical protein